MASCKDKTAVPARPSVFSLNSVKVDGKSDGFTYANLKASPMIQLAFSAQIDPASVPKGIRLSDVAGASVPLNITYQNVNSDLTLLPAVPLGSLGDYTLQLTTDLKSKSGGNLQIPIAVKLRTGLDETNKFPVIPDDSLLTLVQRQTFKYFWDFGHPVSGLAWEHNTSGDVVTTGGSGFGIMAIPVAISRSFISKSQGRERMQKIVAFLGSKADRFHGAFPHWLNGATGKVVPFSAKDNGADLVETSFLMQGLLTARQYFNGSDGDETKLRADIDALYRTMEWDRFRQSGQNVLYWHWSPDQGFVINQPIQG